LSDRQGQHSIRVNKQWRLCFRWTQAGPEDVETDLRLCRFFGLSDGWWLRLQADYDTRTTRGVLTKTLAKIKPWVAAPRVPTI
jgi:hypothetical protein